MCRIFIFILSIGPFCPEDYARVIFPPVTEIFCAVYLVLYRADKFHCFTFTVGLVRLLHAAVETK